MNEDNPEKFRKLLRSRDNKMVAGICGGMAEYFGIDPPVTRVVFVAVTLLSGGLGAVFYLACWAIVPRRPQENRADGGPVEP